MKFVEVVTVANRRVRSSFAAPWAVSKDLVCLVVPTDGFAGYKGHVTNQLQIFLGFGSRTFSFIVVSDLIVKRRAKCLDCPLSEATVPRTPGLSK